MLFAVQRITAAVIAVMFVMMAPVHAEDSISTRGVDPNKYGSIVVDYASGQVLRARNADKPLHPASMTKMMTLLLMFEALDQGRVTLDTRLTVSAYAASRPPSKLGLKKGSTIRVDDAMRIVAVKSANDIATVIGESLAGSEEAFAALMTRRARQLGMTRTTFRNASGLTAPGMASTPRDMAILVRYIIANHPDKMGYFNTRSFVYGGRTFHNSNRLLGKYPGMDGMKTGYTQPAGFNLSATATQDGRRLIVVVFGGRSGAGRNAHVADLLDWGFSNPAETTVVAKAPEAVAEAPRQQPQPLRKPEPALVPRSEIAALVEQMGGPDPAAAAANMAPRTEPVTLAEAIPSGERGRQIEEGSTDGEDAIAALATRTGAAEPRATQRRPGTPATGRGSYLVQVGAFANRQMAEQALSDAKRRTRHLDGAKAGLDKVRRLYRSRFVGLDKTAADAVCRDLRAAKQDCAVMAMQ